MGRSVREVLKGIVAEQQGIDEAAASKYMKSLNDDGRYIAELWG